MKNKDALQMLNDEIKVRKHAMNGKMNLIDKDLNNTLIILCLFILRFIF